MFQRRVVRIVAAAVIAVATLTGATKATAVTTPGPNLHTEVWQPWAGLLDDGPSALLTAAGGLRGVELSTRCGDGPVPSLALAISRLGDALGRADTLHSGVNLEPSTERAIARVVDCLATHVPHLPAWDGDKQGEAPAELQAEWLGAMHDVLGLTLALPALDLPEGVSCLDPLCLVQTGGSGNDTYTANALLIVDEGGDDVYRNNAGGASPVDYLIPVALVFDQGSGADQYVPTVSDLFGAPTIGAGWRGGVGVVVDEGGADLYRAVGNSIGTGSSGGGLLLDQGASNDVYDSPYAAASDPFESHKVNFGAADHGGIGILLDEGGNDSYANAGVQSMGWAGIGALGLLRDVAGNDSYVNTAAPSRDGLEQDQGTVSGISIGVGELGGAGVLLDGGGDDFYTCTARLNYGCGGAGYFPAGFGLLYDRSGNDTYRSPTDSVLSINVPGAFGVATTGGVGVLVDEAGSDSYTAGMQSGGWGIAGSGLFLELGGSDTYAFVGPAPLVGTRGNNSTWLDGAAVEGIGVDRD